MIHLWKYSSYLRKKKNVYLSLQEEQKHINNHMGVLSTPKSNLFQISFTFTGLLRCLSNRQTTSVSLLEVIWVIRSCQVNRTESFRGVNYATWWQIKSLQPKPKTENFNSHSGADELFLRNLWGTNLAHHTNVMCQIDSHPHETSYLCIFFFNLALLRLVSKF